MPVRVRERARGQQHHWHQRLGGGGRKSQNTLKTRRNQGFLEKNTLSPRFGAACIHGSQNEECLNSFSRNTQKARYSPRFGPPPSEHHEHQRGLHEHQRGSGARTRGPWRNEGLMMRTRGCVSQASADAPEALGVNDAHRGGAAVPRKEVCVETHEKRGIYSVFWLLWPRGRGAHDARPCWGGVPPQNLRYKVFFRMFAQGQKAGSMMRAGSRIMSPPGCLAALQKRKQHGIYDVFGTSTHSRLGPHSEPSRLSPEPHARRHAIFRAGRRQWRRPHKASL